MLHLSTEPWTAEHAAELYDVNRWGQGYFSVPPSGVLRVHPERDPERYIDLEALVERLQEQGVGLPVLLRFNGILADRMRTIHQAFHLAIKEHEFRGSYTCVYPIKVNQQRQIVEEIVARGTRYGFGLEAGSKPELLAVIAVSQPDTPILCNGFKDSEYIETALLANKLGRQVTIIVERYRELQLAIQLARKIDVQPRIGVRIKLATRGAGRWHSSGGHRSKFGLTSGEVLRAVAELQEHGMADCLRLVHFHLGSQITNIRPVKEAIIEAARVYADLYRRGAGLEYLDVGGGLGVDYDGSQSSFESSVNYTLQEYANDVVYHVQTVCDDAGIPHPNLISESGRALAAYHSVLVFDVLGCSQHREPQEPPEVDEDAELPLRTLRMTYDNATVRNLRESFHDAQQALDMSLNLFSLGHLSLAERSLAESLFWSICGKLARLIGQLGEPPEELQALDQFLSVNYFCNFSIFRSMPDSWAIQQLFPIMPIHRLNERPTRHAVLCDITCDSDGKIDRFVHRRDMLRTLAVHPYEDSPYYLAAMLVGAYQEILGDMHNLFGDTNAVHVDLRDDGEPVFETVIRGETVSQVLGYVEYHRDDLERRLGQAVQAALAEGRITAEEGRRYLEFYAEGLNGYTELEEPTTSGDG